jgi:hypothetical protein
VRPRHGSWPWPAITGSHSGAITALLSCLGSLEIESPISMAVAAVAEILARCTGPISNWRGAMGVPRYPDPAALAQELSAALGVLAGARRTLADDQLPELQHLINALEPYR